MKKIKAGAKKSLSLLIIIGLLLAYLPEGATFGKDTGVAGDPIPLALSQQEVKDPAAAPAKAPAKEGRPEEAAPASDKKAGTKDRAALLRLQKALKEEADRTFDGDGDAYFSGLSLKAKSPKGPTGKVKIIQGDKGYFALDLKDLKLEKTDQIRLQLDPSIELVTSYYGKEKQAELTALLDRLDSDILSDSSEAQEDVDKAKAITPDYALEEEGLALDKESAEEGTNGLKSYALSPEKADLESARLLFYAKAPVENPPVNLQIDRAGKTYALSLEDASSADKNQSQAADADQDPADPAMSAEAERPAKEINPAKDLSDLITPTEGENSVLFRSSHEHDDYSYGDYGRRQRVEKVWKDGNEKHYGESVTVKVYFSCYIKGKKGSGRIKDKYLTQITLSSRNGWQKELPNEEDIKDNYVRLVEDYIGYVKKIKEVSSLSYRLEEVPVAGYTSTISETRYGFTITNTKTEPEPPPQPEPEPEPEPNPPAQGTQVKDIKKMIDYLGDGAANPDTKVAGKEDYRQYLEFTGQEPKQKEEPGYDFLIAVDTTASMTTRDYYSKITGREERRDDIADKLLNGGDRYSYGDGLLTKLLAANPKNKACVMTFVGDDNYDGERCQLDTQTKVPYGWQSLGRNSEARVSVRYSSGTGTNYCTPLYRAAQLFKDDSVVNDGNRKVLIFITDGEPNESVSRYNPRYDEVTISTSKYADITGDNSKAYRYLQSQVGAIDFHSIAIKIEERRLSELRDLTNTARGQLHLADDAEGLTNAFDKITSSYSTNNLYLEDVLSPYVDLNKEQVDFQIKRIAADGTKTVIWEGGVGNYHNTRYNYTTLGHAVGDGDKYISWASYSLGVGETGKQDRVQVKFREGHNLGNETFQVSYNLKINDTAKAYLAEHSNVYPHKGEFNTDFGKNKTSSGQPGLYSNEEAQLKYMQAGDRQFAAFPHPVVQTEPAPPPQPEPEPEPNPPAPGTQIKDIKKMIDYLGDGAANPDTRVAGKEDYRQYLEFTGQEPKQKEEPGYDFLIAVDTTASMTTRDYYSKITGREERRDDIADKLLNGGDRYSYGDGLLTKLLAANPKNKACVMTFVGDDNYDGERCQLDTQTKVPYGWQSLGRNSEARVSVRYSSGTGTNYCTPLYRAAQLFKDDSVVNDGNRKVLIFITDGEPNESVSRYNPRYDEVTISTSKYADITGDNSKAYRYLQSQVGAIDFHSIAIKIEERRLSELRDLTNTARGQLHLADDAEGLTNAFDKITSSYSTNNLYLEDVLSPYVDLNKEQVDFQIKRIAADGTKTVIWEGGVGNYHNTRYNYTTLGHAVGDGDKYISWASYSLGVGETGKQDRVQVKFREGHNLGNETFQVSYNLKINDTAKAYLAEHSNVYPHKGEFNTDFGKNKTSSGQPGLYSNEEAQLKYMQAGDRQFAVYPHPVVQTANPGLKIKKVDWEKTSQGLKGASFALYRTNPTYSWATAIAAYSGNGSEKTTRFSTDGQGNLFIRGLEAGDYYLKEVAAPAGYRQLDRALSFSLDEEGNVTIKGTPDPAFSQASGGIQVKNIKEGRELPQAGGPGQGSWAGLAILLVLAGAIRWRFSDGKTG